jgi:nanoRNase/pAp phosphatase (c-di-AMP/oligoRNAs hydrolase)
VDLNELIKNRGLHRFTILIAQLDPDALGAAFGMAEYLGRQGIEARYMRVVYCGGMGHPQNRMLVNRFNLPLQRATELDDDVVVLVDSSSTTDSRIPFEFTPQIVIDHHRGNVVPSESNYVLVDETVGSASTLVVELLKGKCGKTTATLLAIGIYSDTKGLISAGPRDREAFKLIAKDLDPKTLRDLNNYDLPLSFLSNLKTALNGVTYKGSTLLTGLGWIRESEGDDLSTIADMLERTEGISQVFVWGIIDDYVRVSARSRNMAEPLDALLKKHFGKCAGAKLTPDGRSEGGGRIELKLDFWNSKGTKDQIEALVSSRMKELIL